MAVLLFIFNQPTSHHTGSKPHNTAYLTYTVLNILNQKTRGVYLIHTVPPGNLRRGAKFSSVWFSNVSVLLTGLVTTER